MNTSFTIITTDWGKFGFVARGQALLATYLPGSDREVRHRIKSDWPGAVEDAEALPAFRKQVDDYFHGRRGSFKVRVELGERTEFQQHVLDACRRIPYGKTATYQDLARAAGRPGAARAVGSTMAQNPLPLVVPCHRVVRTDGGLGGFSSPCGVEDKRKLLALEGVTV